MFGAKFSQDRGPTLRIVADELHAGIALDRVDEFVGKPLEGGERFLENNAGDFPMPGRRILAGGAFLHSAVAGLVGRDSVEPLWRIVLRLDRVSPYRTKNFAQA